MEKSKNFRNIVTGAIMVLVACFAVVLACFAWSAYHNLAAVKGYPMATAMAVLMAAVSAGAVIGFGSLARSLAIDAEEARAFKSEPMFRLIEGTSCVLAAMIGMVVTSALSDAAQVLSDSGFPSAVSLAALLIPAVLMLVLVGSVIRKRHKKREKAE